MDNVHVVCMYCTDDSQLDFVGLCLAMLQKADESAPVSPSTRRNVVTIIDDEPPPSSVGGSCCGGS